MIMNRAVAGKVAEIQFSAFAPVPAKRQAKVTREARRYTGQA